MTQTTLSPKAQLKLLGERLEASKGFDGPTGSRYFHCPIKFGLSPYVRPIQAITGWSVADQPTRRGVLKVRRVFRQEADRLTEYAAFLQETPPSTTAPDWWEARWQRAVETTAELRRILAEVLAEIESILEMVR